MQEKKFYFAPKCNHLWNDELATFSVVFSVSFLADGRNDEAAATPNDGNADVWTLMEDLVLS